MFSAWLQWAVLMPLWLFFVFQFSVSEMLAGAAASALTVVALHSVFRSAPLCFEPRPGWLAQGWRLPGMIATDLLILMETLFRRVLQKQDRSLFMLGRFHTRPDCPGAAQRALAVLFVSTAPNSVVISVDAVNSTMVIHQLKATPLPKLVRKLEE